MAMRTVNRQFGQLASVLAVLALGACATSGPPGSEFDDPYESVNRRIHGFNKDVDRAVLRPVSMGYGTVVPRPLRMGINNFANNLGEPQEAVNALLQANAEDTVVHVFRFLLNSTMGIAGIFDPASAIGLPESDSDFGETLAVWGVGEGAYIELPFLGPSTQRDTAGRVVDFFTDPFSPFIGTGFQGTFPTGTSTASWMLELADTRYEYSDAIDEVLYESADSYAQSRVVYLDNRRYELGTTEDAGYFDPYEDLYPE